MQGMPSRTSGFTRKPSLLLLESDSVEKAPDGRTFARLLDSQVHALSTGTAKWFVPASGKSELLKRLAELAAAGASFDVVVAFGHASPAGIRMGADVGSDWAAFANWIVPFRPSVLVLAACEPGRWMPGDPLFAGCPDLAEIYECPILTDEHAFANRCHDGPRGRPTIIQWPPPDESAQVP